jgi:hypothetical protein
MNVISRIFKAVFNPNHKNGVADFCPPPDYVCNAEIMDEYEEATRETLRQASSKVRESADRSMIAATRTLEMAVNFDNMISTMNGSKR